MNREAEIAKFKDLRKRIRKYGVATLYPIDEYNAYRAPYVRLACMKYGWHIEIRNRHGESLLAVRA